MAFPHWSGGTDVTAHDLSACFAAGAKAIEVHISTEPPHGAIDLMAGDALLHLRDGQKAMFDTPVNTPITSRARPGTVSYVLKVTRYFR
ncbi:MAG: hypothetical protein RLW61_14205 [Gammaproteobacteria bacterium]